MNTLRVRMKRYIQPFERVLAIQELESLGGTKTRFLGLFEETSVDFELQSIRTQRELAKRLAYWETVEQDCTSVATDQSLRESTVNLVRNGIDLGSLKQHLPFNSEIPFPNRRCLRYGPHGIHEYRGKFFPQLVRSLINISGTQGGGVVADPMSGSGTTVVEAMLSGCHGLGMDINPLSVFLGRVKCRLVSANPKKLEASYELVRTELLRAERNKRAQLAYFDTLPKSDQDYLSGWFSQDVLLELDSVSSAIAKVTYSQAKELMLAALSNILRSVSLQKNDDLRVRRETQTDFEAHPRADFLEEVSRSMRAVLAFLYQNGPVTDISHRIIERDAKECAEVFGEKTIDVIITSPPYATALPYLDTDRLSLCYLGLLPRPKHRTRDQQMIGNREVSDHVRRTYWTRFHEEAHALPASVQRLIARIDSLNELTAVGFRRRNLPALLVKYFFDMKEVITGMYGALKSGSFAFVVVGNNHTIAGGQRVEIQTAKLLQDIAALVGFEPVDSLPMEMLVSRDIFRKNTVSSEEILAFRRPSQI